MLGHINIVLILELKQDYIIIRKNLRGVEINKSRNSNTIILCTIYTKNIIYKHTKHQQP